MSLENNDPAEVPNKNRFIPLCNSIRQLSALQYFLPLGLSIVTDSTVKAGNESFNSPTGSTETGHSGNGYARITYLGK